MPAFGAYAGGLNVRDRAFTNIFQTLTFTAHMLGQQRVYAVAAKHRLPDQRYRRLNPGLNTTGGEPSGS